MNHLPFGPSPAAVVLVVGAYAFLLATSGRVVTHTLRRVPSDDNVPTGRERDVGVLVGKCENVLTLTFVLAGAYTALAVVFGAKGIVRKDDIEKNSLFYLAGTLVNLTYSVVVGLALSLAVTVV